MSNHSHDPVDNSVLQISSVLENIVQKNHSVIFYVKRNWISIVGNEYHKLSEPLAVKWPKVAEGEQFKPGLLHIGVESGSSAVLHIPHMKKQIIDRVNRFVGYVAIDDIYIKSVRIVTPILYTDNIANKTLSKKEYKIINELTDHVSNPQLKAALRQLGENIYKKSK